MILLIDNYDSFTYNLVNQLESLGQSVDVRYNDTDLSQIDLDKYQGLVLSPGPCLPKDSNHLNQIIDLAVNKIPVLGICLGMQALLEYYGGHLNKLIKPCHGKVEDVICEGDGLFYTLSRKEQVVRYHSWYADKVPSVFSVTSTTDAGECMAIESIGEQVFGIQFHPESILTTNGIHMLRNWLRIANIIPSY